MRKIEEIICGLHSPNIYSLTQQKVCQLVHEAEKVFLVYFRKSDQVMETGVIVHRGLCFQVCTFPPTTGRKELMFI